MSSFMLHRSNCILDAGDGTLVAEDLHDCVQIGGVGLTCNGLTDESGDIRNRAGECAGICLVCLHIRGKAHIFLITHLLNFGLSVRRLIKLTGKIISISTVLLTIIATAGSIIMAGFMGTPILRGVSYVLLFGSVLYLFQVVGREDLSWLKGLIKRKGSHL